MVIVRRHSIVSGDMCKSCIKGWFWKTTKFNLTRGWWGQISFFMTIGYLTSNAVRYASAQGLEAAPESGYASEGVPVQPPQASPGFPAVAASRSSTGGALDAYKGQLPAAGSFSSRQSDGAPDDVVKGSRAAGLLLAVVGCALTAFAWLLASKGSVYIYPAFLGPFSVLGGIGWALAPPPDYGKKPVFPLLIFGLLGVVAGGLNLLFLLA
ncbi:MAG TPA: hypothetical protein VJX67_09990 [Blastocatellia bacterium]|nr:hypothetical protein [Blastocatellia bacterium]